MRSPPLHEQPRPRRGRPAGQRPATPRARAAWRGCARPPNRWHAPPRPSPAPVRRRRVPGHADAASPPTPHAGTQTPPGCRSTTTGARWSPACRTAIRLARVLRGQALAPLRATRLDDRPTRAGAHARGEAVLALATAVVG